jgi:Fe-S oxidoreductase
LRLALSGQLGPDALTSQAMYETLELCVSCKGCRRECPTGVDMAKMKIEFMHHYVKRHGLSRKDRLIAYLPRYAPIAARFAPLLNLRNHLPGLPWMTEKLLGFSARRSLPAWRRDWFRDDEISSRPAPSRSGAGGDSTLADPREVALFVDTFNRYFEPENARAAADVLQAAGYHVQLPHAADSARPLCCGRTFLASGLVDEAKTEARRMLEALTPFIERDIPIVGLEPSCLLTLRDEYRSLLGRDASAGQARQALLFEEFLAREAKAGKLDLKLNALPQKKALLHGHCHQKAFNVMGSVNQVLGLIPGLKVETIESSCCGMAGAFGYDAEHFDVSMKMAEISLLPKVRSAAGDELIVADGTSCRHQIHDGSGRGAQHVARVLRAAL